MPSYTSRNSEERSYSKLWTHKGNKFVIGTIHGEPIEIVAQYNPKELSRQVQAQWNDNPNTSAAQSKTSQSGVWAEYGTTRPRSVNLELLFDGYEENISVASIVEDLERLALPVDMNSSDPTKRRPPLCVAVWGTQQLRCVVESVATKLSMFDLSGEPLRATCTIALKQVDVAAMLEVEAKSSTERLRASSGGFQLTKVEPSRNPYPPEDSKPTRVPPYRQPPPDNSANPSAAAGSTSSKKPQPQPAAAPTPAAPAPAPAPDAAAPIETKPTVTNTSAPAPAADEPIVTQPTVYNSAPTAAVADAQTGTPSAKVNPNALDGAQPGTGDVFESKQGTPSAKVNPNSLDGAQPGTGDVFEKDSAPAPDAVSSADAQDPDAKRMGVYKKLE